MGAVNFVQRVIGKYAGQAVEVAGNIAVQILEFDGDIFSVQKDTVAVPSRTRVSMPGFASLIKSIGFVSPIENAGTATDPIVTLDSDSEPTADTIARRTSDGSLLGTSFAPASSGVPSIGVLKGPTNSVLVATKIGGNDAKVVESSASTLIFGDDDEATETWVRAKSTGSIKFRFGTSNAAVVELDGNGFKVSVNGQTVLRCDESGGAPRVAFLGTAPIAQQAVVIDTSHIVDPAAVTAVRDVCNALSNTGLFDFTFI